MKPKIMHMYWNGSPMSYLQYLTIASFKKHNPKWAVWLWMPKTPNLSQPEWKSGEQADPYTGEDYLDKAKAASEVKIIDFETLGISDDLPETQKSDFFRWYLLYEYGGAWSDSDVLYIRSMDKLMKRKFDSLISFVIYPANSFYITLPKTKLFEDMYKEAKRTIDSGGNSNYQAVCSGVGLRLYRSFEGVVSTYPGSKIINVENEVVYPYDPHTDLNNVYDSDINQMFYGTLDKTTPKTVGMHWYNGHPLAKKYQNDFAKYRDNKSIISKYAREYDV
jgi:hypothetical protein